MNKNKGKKVEKWIDLNNLPRLKNGTIDWQKSAGITLSFIYNGIFGKLEILKYIGLSQCLVLITTKKRSIKCKITSYNIRYCMFGRILQEPIGLTHPELIKYFVNRADAFIYAAHSKHITDMQCPVCGAIKQQVVSVLTDYGFGCQMCGDGVSYPEKLMYSILTQLKINFKNQVTKLSPGFEWIVKNYRYDFCIYLKNKKYIIEMDGHMHTIDKFTSCKDVQKADIEKDKLAQNHGIDVIRIDCAYKNMNKRFEYIKSNILNSELNKLIDFSLADWDIAHKYAISNNVQLAAESWNNGALNSYEVGKILGVSGVTAQNYLKTAGDLGMCNYSNSEVNKRRKLRIMETKQRNGSPIALLKNNEIVGVFYGVCDAERQSDILYGEHINHQNLSAVINGRRSHVKGYTARHITHEEYEQLLPQFSQQYKINKAI